MVYSVYTSSSPTAAGPRTAPGTKAVTLYEKGLSDTWGKTIPISAGIRRMPSYPIWLRNYMTYTRGGGTAYFTVGNVQFVGQLAVIPAGRKAQDGTLVTWAVSFGYPLDPDESSGRVVRKIWADGRLVWSSPTGARKGADVTQGFSWQFYPGSETQDQDPDMVSDNGTKETPAYRGMMYMVIKDFPLTNFACHIPGITAEIADSQYNRTGIDSEGKTTDSLMNVATQLQLFCNGQPWNYNGIANNKLDFHEDSFFPVDKEDMGMANNGVIIDQDWTLADILNAYARFYDFNFLEAKFGLKFLKPVTSGQFNVAAVLEDRDLIAVNEAGALVTTRADPGQAPSIMTVSYYDVSQQFQLSQQRARRAQFPQQTLFVTTAGDIKVPIICTASRALTGCTRALYRGAHEKVAHQFTLPPNFIYLEPGDVVQINRRSGKKYFAIIVNMEVQSDLSINMVAINIAYNKPGNLIGYGGQQVLVRITNGIGVGDFQNQNTLHPFTRT